MEEPAANKDQALAPVAESENTEKPDQESEPAKDEKGEEDDLPYPYNRKTERWYLMVRFERIMIAINPALFRSSIIKKTQLIF
jgi:hypothetical protein